MMENFTIVESIKSLNDNVYIHIFMVSIMMDIFSGIVKAVKQKRLNSSVGLNGMLRHLLIIFVVMVFCIYMPILGLEKYVVWVIGYFVLQYVVSIIENLGEIGVPLPENLKDIVYKLNESFDAKLDSKLLKIDTMVVNKHETIETKDVNKNG